MGEERRQDLVVRDLKGQDSAIVRYEKVVSEVMNRVSPLRHRVHAIGIGHTGRLCVVVVTPGPNPVLLSGGWDGTVLAWNLHTGECLAEFQNEGAVVESISVLGDGAQFVTGGDDGVARLWDIKSHSVCQRFKGHQGQLYSVCVTPDSRHCLTGGRDCTMRLWDLDRGTLERVFVGHQDAVKCIRMTPDGQIVTSSHDATLRLWDMANGRTIRIFRGHRSCINSIWVTQDGKHVLSAGAENVAHLWDLDSGEIVQTYTGHRSASMLIKDEPDDSFPTNTRYIRCESAMTGVTHFTSCTSVSSVCEISEGLVATTSWDRTCRIYDMDTGRCLKVLMGHEGPAEWCCPAEGGEKIVTAGWDHTARIFDVRNKECEAEVVFTSHSTPVLSACLSPEEDSLITVGDKWLRVWDLTTGQERHTFSLPQTDMSSLCVTPDGRYALVATADRRVHRIDLREQEEMDPLTEGEALITGVAVSRDGKLAATSSIDQKGRIYDLRSNGCSMVLQGHSEGLSSICFVEHRGPGNIAMESRMARRVVTTSGDRTARLWDVQTGRCLMIYRIGHTDEVTCASVLPSGQHLITGSFDSNAILWDLRSGRQVGIYEGHEAGITCMALTPDARFLITGSLDKTLRKFDIATGECLATYRGHTGKVTSIAISRCGKRAFSGSVDHTLRCWDLQEDASLVTLHHLKEGFLWTTPPEDSAPSGWFWTNQMGFIRVLDARDDGKGSPNEVAARDRDDYCTAKNRREMVMTRLRSTEEAQRLAVANERIRTGERGQVWTRRFDPSTRRLLDAGKD